MPLRSTEVLLRKTGIRIGYDFMHESHAVILDAERVVIEAKPLEESGHGDAITVHAALPGHPYRHRLNDALAISLRPDKPSDRLEALRDKMNIAATAKGGEVYSEGSATIYVKPAGAHIIIEPSARYVMFSVSPDVRRKAETLYVQALRPTLINVLLDKIQTVMIFYAEPVRIKIEDSALTSRMTIEPLSRLPATRKN